MRKKFDIKYRPLIEIGEYKVVTDCGESVEIVKWNCKGKCPILAVIDDGDTSDSCFFTEDGSSLNEKDWLYIETPELELTELKQLKASVSDDLEMAAKEDARVKRSDDTDDFYDLNRASGFVDGAQWQKQQMMKETVLCGSDGWFINNKRNCRKNGRFHKYYVSTITHDKPLPMENGKDYRLIVIKED